MSSEAVPPLPRTSGLTRIDIGDVIVMYSDGVTEAEDGAGWWTN